MKKTLAVIIASLMIISLCSCSKGSQEQTSSSSERSAVQTNAAESSNVSQTEVTSQPENSTSSVTELPPVETPEFNDTTDYTSTLAGKYLDVSKLTDKTKKDVIDVINSDSLYLNINGSLAIAKGISTDFAVTASKDGSLLYLCTTVLGKDSIILRNDDGIYRLNSADKTASLLQKGISESSDETSPVYSNDGLNKAISFITSIFGANELSFVKNGAEEYKGSALTYEEYKAGKAVIRLYSEGSTLKYITVDNNGNVSEITINALSPEAEPSLFVIPQDYKVK